MKWCSYGIYASNLFLIVTFNTHCIYYYQIGKMQMRPFKKPVGPRRGNVFQSMTWDLTRTLCNAHSHA